jgi:Ni/Co efflux regulator RcnB
MHVIFRSSFLPAVLLLAAAPLATAQSYPPPLPDPIAPAVIGKPLDQIGPPKPLRLPRSPGAKQAPKSTAARPAPPSTKIARQPAAGPHAAAPNTTARNTSAPNTAQPARATAPNTAQLGAGSQRPAKQAVDDRADPHAQLVGVGAGTHFARKPLAPGVYFGDKQRMAVRKYYEAHPVSGAPAHWEIGQPVPDGVRLTPVPQGLLASLPAQPPGHRYVQLGGEVVLIATGSKMVVDGIPRSPG